MRVVLQALDARLAAAVLEVPHAAQAGDRELGGEVRERIQDEGAFVQPGVRQRERGRRERYVGVEQDVQIERARTPARSRTAAVPHLDLLEAGEQGLGREPGLGAGDRVQVIRLTGWTEGRALI